MPYHRAVIFETPLISWQEVSLVAAVPAWSAEYRVGSPRLLLPLTSCFECRVGASSFVCDSSSALWLTPAQTYRMRRPSAGQRSALFVFDSLGAGTVRRSALPLDRHVALRAWWQQLAVGRIDRLTLEENLIDLWHTFLNLADDSPGLPHRAVERAREYVASDPGRDDTLIEIARAAHCSPYHLARLFRRHTGRSLHRYRTQLRMSLALDRLQRGERDLNTLAADLGYASHSHFTATFRHTFGVVPNQMRRNLTAQILR